MDRLPDLPPPPGAVVPPTTQNTTTADDDDFYRTLDEAHKAWDELLGQDKFRLVMKLKPGDTMVVANQVRVSSKRRVSFFLMNLLLRFLITVFRSDRFHSAYVCVCGNVLYSDAFMDGTVSGPRPTLPARLWAVM